MPGAAPPARTGGAGGLVRGADAGPSRRPRRWAARVAEIADQDWGEAWKKGLGAILGGAGLRPAVLDGRPRSRRGTVEVVLDPGHGLRHRHPPTTALCLAALSDLLPRRPGAAVLDVGTGSGLLAIAARKLGAGRVRGNDNDPVAVEVARENAARNGVEVELAGEPLAGHPGPVRPGGRQHPRQHAGRARAGRSPPTWRPAAWCSLSGILAPQEEEVRRRLRRGRPAPRAPALDRRDGEWSLLAFARERPRRDAAARSSCRRSGSAAERAALTPEAAPLPARRAPARRRAPSSSCSTARAAPTRPTSRPGSRRCALGAAARGAGRAPALWLLVALAKGEKMDLVVQKATELGAAADLPFAGRALGGPARPGRGEARAERWRRIAAEAARQCGRADVAGGGAPPRSPPRSPRYPPASPGSCSTRAASRSARVAPSAGRGRGGGPEGGLIARGGRALRGGRRPPGVAGAPHAPRRDRGRRGGRAPAGAVRRPGVTGREEPETDPERSAGQVHVATQAGGCTSLTPPSPRLVASSSCAAPVAIARRRTGPSSARAAARR